MPHEESDKEQVKSFVTNPTDPHDEIPIMIGKLYIDVTKKTKIELQSGLTGVRQYEQEEALKERMELERQIEQQQKVVQEATKVVDKAANELDQLKKRLETASNNYKRKYPES